MKTIAVIFGGKSTEHDVSIVTALSSVIRPLELTKQYNVEAVYIAKDGNWYWDAKLKDIHLFQSGEIDDFIHKAPKIQVLFDNGLTLVKSGRFANSKQSKKIDVVFPALHGTYGEDGALMGLLEMAGVAYVGCGVAASAVAMDKLLAKELAMGCGIKTAQFLSFTKAQLENLNDAIASVTSKLTYPLFIKPTHLGSSIGITRATNENELRNGIEVAAHYDDMVIVEEAVPNLIEVTLPIMGEPDNPIPALLERPLTKSEDFFDFETKYMQGGKKGGKKGAGKGAQGYSTIPADIPKPLYDKAEQVGLAVYSALGCSGIARVDMLIDSQRGEVYFNEVNPMPGGLYAHNWKAAGISAVDLVQKLVNFAEARHEQTSQRTTAFTTNYLKQF